MIAIMETIDGASTRVVIIIGAGVLFVLAVVDRWLAARGWE